MKTLSDPKSCPLSVLPGWGPSTSGFHLRVAIWVLHLQISHPYSGQGRRLQIKHFIFILRDFAFLFISQKVHVHTHVQTHTHSEKENEGIGQHRVVFSEGMQGSGPVHKWNLLPDFWTWGLAVSREHCDPGLLTKEGFRRPLEHVHPCVCTCLCMDVYIHAEIQGQTQIAFLSLCSFIL